MTTRRDGGASRRPTDPPPRRFRRWAAAAGLLLAAAGIQVVSPEPAQAATGITINGSSGGRTLDGVGAISGGGGNSRLLIDYPEPQRSDILDYLFKPGYGAAMQIMKTEIGGDTNSTSGAEPSHEHTRGAINCNRGYEWWLMGEAKARNPNIKLVGLAWGAPGWIGNNTFFTNDAIDYLVAWLGCATSHGLTIDYLGGWNEKGRDLTWYKNLRSALNSRGYAAVKIVASDDFGWGPADDAQRDPAFGNAIAVYGSHYVCGYRSAQSSCPSSTNAINSGKSLWASENGSDDYNAGANALARGINRGYIDGKMTGYLNWPVIAAITPNVPWSTTGLAVAQQPWSGNYSIGKNAWVMGQTTQFSAPGWKYLDSSSGYIGGNRNNGSFVSLKSPNNSNYSTVIETMDAGSAQDLQFNVTGGLSTGTVHVWSTNVRSNNQADFFVKRSDITPSNGSFSLTVQPGYVYSITTTTGQGKGTATSPAQRSLALPYTDTFDSYQTGREAKYLSDHQGSFEVVACGASRTGQCVRQMSEQAPIYWTDGHAEPFTLLGDLGWRDYTVSSDVMLEKSGYAQLIGRAGNYNHQGPQNLNGYYLRVADNGSWSIRSNNTSGNQRTLASGTTAALGTGRWHNVALTMSGSSLTATIDGTIVGRATDSAFSAGQIGYATGQGVTAQFDNLKIYSGSVPPDPTPTPSPSVSPSVPVSPSPSGPGGCTATYKVVSEWSGGFQSEITVTNASSGASTGWQAAFTLADGQQVSQSWNADVKQSGSTVTATNVSYNGTLAPGASATFGFLGSRTGNSTSAPTVSCTLS
ncbi:ricin-type beta-trefoil lectin domain protein [Paractinoplanes ferrugineus]|uniref:galactosylceramidase n=1 Tax=Paractinoplanes ferrugineus TaxID=113564 RepID=A0A919MME0_9ACTN|nr:cellulose binding domain-containing protein [Actinoplanes ferrugineus]GIE13157.1 galactosylceramidase [Actinoplanes ferrugineus]